MPLPDSLCRTFEGQDSVSKRWFPTKRSSDFKGNLAGQIIILLQKELQSNMSGLDEFFREDGYLFQAHVSAIKGEQEHQESCITCRRTMQAAYLGKSDRPQKLGTPPSKGLGSFLGCL